MNRIVTYILGTLIVLAASSTMASAQEYVNTPVEISKEKVRVDGKICYSHVVLEKQTLYSISKAYNVSIDDIYKFNPTVKETGLKKNSIIIIPSQDAIKSEPQPQVVEKVEKEEKTQRVHIAKWYEDLDVIAEQYGVTADDIMAANKLKGRKLSKRQKLIIPYPGEEIEKAASDSTQAIADNEIIEDTIVEENLDSTLAEPAKGSVNATILLPFTTSTGEPNKNNLDFYCGALLAIYDLGNEGIGCNLNVHDVNNRNSQFNADHLSDSDVIIGPVSTADLTRLFTLAGENTLVVSPLDPRAEKLVTSHRSMIQIPTPQNIQYRDLIAWIKEDFSEGDKVVMITEKGARQNAVTTVMKEALDSSYLNYNTFSYSILEGRDVTQPLTDLMTMEGSNRILVASESEAFVNDVIRNLNLLIYNNIDITLYAPSKIRGFETIEVENLHKTSMHVSLGYYIDYENAKVKDFLLKYRALYNTEPNQFAFQGYDVAKYFIELCAKHGSDWRSHIEKSGAKMLQSSFDIHQQPIGGYQNNGVRRIIYENGYSVKTIK